MVVLNKIYTRTGDAGDTALGNNERVAKYAPRVAAYGTADELNAQVGVARLQADAETDAALMRIQNDLFDLGADRGRPEGSEKKGTEGLRIPDLQVKRLEDEIDRMNADLEPLTSFILPGGTEASAWLHLGRTEVRRCERLICALAETEDVNPETVKYANRLSDHLFVLARTLNDRGKKDVLWQPGQHR